MLKGDDTIQATNIEANTQIDNNHSVEETVSTPFNTSDLQQNQTDEGLESIQTINKNDYSIKDFSGWLQIYLCVVIFCNFGLLFIEGNYGDTGYWENWVQQLATTGYTNFNGNYPPMYIHWLYIVSKIYSVLGVAIENNILLKYLSQIPVLLSHLALTTFVFFLVKKHTDNKLHFHAAMLIAACNPAILFNGPIWGQMDIIPLIPVIAALLAGTSERKQIFTFPLYIIALLTKFQMIAFAPVFGVIFFHNYKTHLLGAILCLLTIVLAFLPSIVTHNFIQAFKLAYIDVLSQYSATTMGASNIWIILTGNAAPDSIILFGIDPQSKLSLLFTAKHFGITVFAIVCLCVFIKGMAKLAKNKFQQGQTLITGDILFLAMICTVSFFTFLPAMHERYLLPAVIIATTYYATAPTKIIYPIMFAFISSFNLAMTLGIKMKLVWPSISWIMLAAFFYGLFELLFGEKWVNFAKKIFNSVKSIKWLSLWVFIISAVFMTQLLYTKTKINNITLSANQMLLTQIMPISSSQDYGSLRTNLSVNGTALNVGGLRYANGFGTHANSVIDFVLPDNVETLSFIVGIDNEVENAEVIFSVWGDDRQLWQSPVIYGPEKNLPTITLNIAGIKKLSLRVSGVNGVSNDHADWINPVITLKNPSTTSTILSNP